MNSAVVVTLRCTVWLVVNTAIPQQCSPLPTYQMERSKGNCVWVRPLLSPIRWDFWLHKGEGHSSELVGQKSPQPPFWLSPSAQPGLTHGCQGRLPACGRFLCHAIGCFTTTGGQWKRVSKRWRQRRAGAVRTQHRKAVCCLPGRETRNILGLLISLTVQLLSAHVHGLSGHGKLWVEERKSTAML